MKNEDDGLYLRPSNQEKGPCASGKLEAQHADALWLTRAAATGIGYTRPHWADGSRCDQAVAVTDREVAVE